MFQKLLFIFAGVLAVLICSSCLLDDKFPKVPLLQIASTRFDWTNKVIEIQAYIQDQGEGWEDVGIEWMVERPWSPEIYGTKAFATNNSTIEITTTIAVPDSLVGMNYQIRMYADLNNERFFSEGVTIVASSWHQKTTLGEEIERKLFSFTIGEQPYIGVESGGIDLWRYTSSNDSWAQMTSPRAENWEKANGFSWQGKGYVFIAPSFGDWIELWEFNPLTNSWDEKDELPGSRIGFAGRHGLTAFCINDKGYLHFSDNCNPTVQSELWEFDLLSNTWTDRRSYVGKGRTDLISFVIDDRAYMGLGYFCDGYDRNLWKYDPYADIWLNVEHLFPGQFRMGAISFCTINKAYIGLGFYDGSVDEDYLKDLWEFSPFEGQPWSRMEDIPAAGTNQAFAVGAKNRGFVGLGNVSNTLDRTFLEFRP